ncbi:uncharacterized protein Z520_05104 [Fonsecaea multimorphosa CBS 102226]|uniref:DUF4048 domain-containing protein n=1 Tax=Fonsecaea multimorphosa CBS 102226 TaxID=1442371 RepID=A0A0D2KS61_9EURO|nr:uncharacterized protein Z520_05104 [Fonsecaea multimorphosa CBS 102226]KIX99528.1 hypothetical protein Z520_05104 [Fonsecaea multimorphosa CBS 102226]OAL25521.1 hypothetical protein AYO22_04840 [Fonsecaea multimorphosa]
MEIVSSAVSSQHLPPNDPLEPADHDSDAQTNPTPAPTTIATVPRRHTKGLSLNFPILVPTSVSYTQSPTLASGVQSPIESAKSSPPIRGVPFRGPDPATEAQEKAKTRGSAEFLTLLAAQERKVLELKEELQRAEADLLVLKKQWAAYEANKKRDEVRQVKKLQPVALGDVMGGEGVVAEDDLDEERKRKRALVERGYTSQPAAASNAGSNGLVRKGSKRVFEGGRHTRTLSLLSPTSSKGAPKPADETQSTQEDTVNADGEDMNRPSFSRMPTLDGLISGDALPLGFGKTYKDLAAHRRSLPPVAADILVKQGKQVYDGVREGLWTFFEDIRQATVGEEGINGTAAQQRPARPAHRKAARKASDRQGKLSSKDSTEIPDPRPMEPSFWKEFGLDTPQKNSTRPKAAEKLNGHVQQKSSTDSSNTPSLLPDLNDHDEIEDGWDAWDSPVSTRGPLIAGMEEVRPKPEDGEAGLPWPELDRITPSKLTRTVSDLMKEWESSQEDPTKTSGLANGQMHILDSPHM